MSTTKLPETLRQRVRLAARRKGVRIADVYRIALERYCDSEQIVLPVSRYDDVFGVANGETGAIGAQSEAIYAQILAAKNDVSEPAAGLTNCPK